MRQLGTITDERQAERFAAWLMAQRIDAHAEEAAGAGWAIWVRDEDHLPQAREALAHFRAHPEDPRYANAERQAAELVRQEEAKRRDAQKNVVQMRSRWGNPGGALGGGPRRCPIILLLIGLSILTGIIAYEDTLGSDREGPPAPPSEIYRSLLFADPRPPVPDERPFSIWADVGRGQVWRAITPIFIHYGWPHLIFNVLCLYSFGSQIEDKRGSRMLLGLVLLLAVTSNVGQAVESGVRYLGPHFGGLSGVVYGLFGFLFVKTRYDNRSGYFLSPITSFMAILWFALCIAGEFPPMDRILPEDMTHVANSAHAVGLAVGAAAAYAPLLLRKPA